MPSPQYHHVKIDIWQTPEFTELKIGEWNEITDNGMVTKVDIPKTTDAVAIAAIVRYLVRRFGVRTCFEALQQYQ